jgi:hypothetical protein
VALSVPPDEIVPLLLILVVVGLLAAFTATRQIRW